MNIRPATAADVAGYLAASHIGDGRPVPTVRAWAAEHAGDVVGFAGIAYGPVLIAFAEMREGAERYPVTIMRVARKVLDLLRAASSSVYAEASETYPNSEAFLRRLGFQHVDGRVYVWQN